MNKSVSMPRTQQGFSYVEVLVAMFILAIAIVPAMEAIQSGIQGAGIHESLTRQHYAVIKCMEEVQAKSYGDLLNAAQTAGNATTASNSFDTECKQTEQVLVFLALYDADDTVPIDLSNPDIDGNPFTFVDSDIDSDGDIYTGDTSNLLWLRVELENSVLKLETLVTR
jgi:prepilin-type N-terminal cleavage/methylation domain-containing protein